MIGDPYEILGASPQDDERQLRRRYLELVRQYPPDRSPEKFAAIRAAFDEVRDPLKRIEKSLFRVESSESLAAIESELRERLQRTSFSLETLLALAGDS